MFWLWFLIMLFTTISIILFTLSIEIKSLYSNIRKSAKATSRAIDKTIESGKQSRIGRFIKFTDEIILNSNIRVYIPYNVLIHLLICFIFATLSFLWVSQYMNLLTSVLFSVLGFILPYSILQLITTLMIDKIKKYSVDFLIILKNYTVATGDIFIAFEKSKSYLIEPLKTYVDIMVYEYKHKIPAVTCMNNFIKKVGYSELKIFMENLKIAYLQGSDIVLLIDEFINEISNLNDDSDKEDTEDKILSIGLYLLLLLNFSVIFYILNSKYKLEITNTFLGQVVFIIDIIISIYIIYMTLEKSD